MSRPNSANGDGDGENDRKECFHGTKVSLPLARVRLRIFAVIGVSNEDSPPARINGWNAAPTPTGFAEIFADDFPVLFKMILRPTENLIASRGRTAASVRW